MIPTSCDTMVALGDATVNGQTIFAKNSDRPRDECQPLVQRPRRSHAPGAMARCQFIRLPEAEVAYRHVGSRPHWCWGYEHGFNEHQVVIGNEGLRSRLPEYSEPKLIGMEIIRLGLERARTAAEAVEVMTDLIGRHGQGKFANDAGVRTYDNGYIVADPHEAYVIETAGHQWAVKRVASTLGISNIYSLGADWDRLSPDAQRDAVRRGWWSPGSGRFDFAGAYALANRELDEDTAALVANLLHTPPVELGLPMAAWTTDELQRVLRERHGISASAEAIGGVRVEQSGGLRRARSCALLEQHAGAIDVTTMMAILSDHSDGQSPGEPFQTGIRSDRVTICVHNLPDGARANTAASLVADLCADGSRLPIYWCSMYSPCLGVFLPLFIEGGIPHALSVGGSAPDESSPWWGFHRLSELARAKGQEGVALARRRWAPFHERLLVSAYQVARQGRRLLDMDRADEAGEMLTGYMAENTSAMLAILAELLDDLAAQGSVP